MTGVFTVMFITNNMTEEEDIWINKNEWMLASSYFYFTMWVELHYLQAILQLLEGCIPGKWQSVYFCAMKYNESVGTWVREWLPQMAVLWKNKTFQASWCKVHDKGYRINNPRRMVGFGSSQDESHNLHLVLCRSVECYQAGIVWYTNHLCSHM